MKRRALTWLLAAGAVAQAPEDPVIRVTSNLVQLDVVVTDNRDRLVTDLKKEDFEVLQDGKPQPVTNFSFVDMSAPLSPAPTGVRTGKSIQRANVRRSIAIVVDDLRLDWNNLIDVRAALKKYLDSQILPGDLVSISFTSSSAGALSQFTTNHELLKTAVDRIKINSTAAQEITLSGDAYDRFSLAALRRVVDSMAELPGRKSVMVFASPTSRAMTNEGLIRELIGRANSAGVSVYLVWPVRAGTSRFGGAMAATGDGDGGGGGTSLNAAQLDAAAGVVIPLETLGSPLGGGPGGPDELMWGRLASGTGGLYTGIGYDLRKALDKILTDQGSYYLLGYRPSQDSFDRKSHKIEVKVRRPGLKVRTHSDFIADPPAQVGGTVLDVLSRAVDSPFGATTIRTSLWPIFSAGGKEPVISTAVFVDGRDLQFERLPNGTYRGGVEFILKTVDTNDLESAETKRGFRLSLTAEVWKKISQTGVSYVIPHPVNGPGLYQVRIAVRDTVSGDVGSASQIVEIPDLKKKSLALSALLLHDAEENANPLSAPATRVFERGRAIEWMTEVYHPKVASASNAPHLYSSIRLYREGILVSELPFASTASKPLPGGHAFAQGSLPLNADLEPGGYTMELLVTDEPPERKAQPSSQRIDLEII